MAVTKVMLVLLVCAGLVLGGVRAAGEAGVNRSSGRLYDSNNEPFRGHYPQETITRRRVTSSGSSDPPRRTSDSAEVPYGREEQREDLPPSEKQPRFEPRQLYPVFIPVNYEVNRFPASDRSLTSENSRALNNPRLVMDENFNIRFDNPYIVPLAKPMALVLNSPAMAREDIPYSDKMMIPFPVLVKARDPLPDRDYRDYRGGDGNAEHRSNDDDDFYLDDTSPRTSDKTPSSSKKSWTNGTTTYHNTNDLPGERSPGTSIDYERATGSKNPQSFSTIYQKYNDGFNDSSSGEPSSSVYPSKIFSEMYHTMPKYPIDSLESQEYSSSPRKKYAEKVPSAKDKVLQRPKVRATTKYPSRGHAYSATTGLEWVTNANSSKGRSNSPDNRRFVIYEAGNTSAASTSKTSQPDYLNLSTTKPDGPEIGEQFWRENI